MEKEVSVTACKGEAQAWKVVVELLTAEYALLGAVTMVSVTACKGEAQAWQSVVEPLTAAYALLGAVMMVSVSACKGEAQAWQSAEEALTAAYASFGAVAIVRVELFTVRAMCSSLVAVEMLYCSPGVVVVFMTLTRLFLVL